MRPPFIDPVVIVDVPEDSTAVTEETFGPLLVVNRVPDVDEAVRRANATGYGLAGHGVLQGPRRGDRGPAALRDGVAVTSFKRTSRGMAALLGIIRLRHGR